MFVTPIIVRWKQSQKFSDMKKNIVKDKVTQFKNIDKN